MHKYVWILCVVGMLAPACARTVNVDQQKAALMEADKAWAQTTTDAEKLMTYFAPDAALSPQGMPVAQGTDAIRQAITGMMAMPGFALTWEAAKADVGASIGRHRRLRRWHMEGGAGHFQRRRASAPSSTGACDQEGIEPTVTRHTMAPRHHAGEPWGDRVIGRPRTCRYRVRARYRLRRGKSRSRSSARSAR